MTDRETSPCQETRWGKDETFTFCNATLTSLFFFGGEFWKFLTFLEGEDDPGFKKLSKRRQSNFIACLT